MPGPPLSTLEYDYPVEQLALEPGDTLVLVTDGITEAQDHEQDLYGRNRIVETLAREAPAATVICDAIRDDVRRFEGHAEPTDDLTVLAMRFLGSAGA